jgi:hypothetical protein
MLEEVAQGIEERQAEMVRMFKNNSEKHAELAEVEKNIKRRQTLLDITSRGVKESMPRLAEDRKRMEKGTRDEESGNCTESPGLWERPEEKRVKASGLKVMGVFTLCGVLATLGWGGVTN